MIENYLQPPWNKLTFSILIILGAFIARFAVKLIIDRIGLKITQKTKTDLDDKILLALRKHSKYIIIFLALYYILQVNTEYFSPGLLSVFDGIFYIIFFLIVLSLVLFAVGIFIDRYLNILSAKSDVRVITEFGPLIQRVTKALILIVGLSIAFGHFNIDIEGIIVSLGVGSLALAFAAQDTLANMISGFVIMIDRPFRKGDRIKLESGEVGDVEDIGLRSIKIKDFENTIHIIPNKEIANKRVINYSYPDTTIRVKINVGVAYGSDIQTVKNILLAVFKEHQEILAEPPPDVYFVNMGESSLDFMVVGRVEAYTNQWRVSEELRVIIYDKLVDAGIDIPFPQRTLHISDDSLKSLSKSKS